MSILRLITKAYIFLVFLLICSQNLYGQWDLIEKALQQTDTSDYIPYYYDGALDYNLMIASSRGYVDEIRRLIGKGADVDAATYEGATPLVLAVSNNKINSVKTLLEYKPDPDKATAAHETPLMIAVKNRSFDIAEALIRAGADPDYRDRQGATPLHFASLYGYLDITDLLLYYDAAVDLKTNDGTTPLLSAVWAGNADVADLLVQNGAGIEEKNNEGLTPFLLASYLGDTLIMDLLHRHGAEMYVTDNEGHNALALAILSGSTSAAGYLLKNGDKWAGAAVDPYTVASKTQKRDMIKLLEDYHIPGKVKREIDQVSVSLSDRFFIHDNYQGLSISFKEPVSNTGFFAGIDTKFLYTRVLMKQTDHLFYQYRDRGSMVYAGVFKDFPLTNNPVKNFYFSPSLAGGYSFPGNLKGTYLKTGDKFRIIPAATFRWTAMNITINGGIEYVKSEFYHHGPVWLRFGVSYNYYFDNVRTKIKPIRWHLR